MTDEYITSDGSSATEFASWVFNKANPNYTPGLSFNRVELEKRLKLGQFMHQECEDLWRWLRKVNPGPLSEGKWKLCYADSHSNDSPPILWASRLSYDGQPLSCRPDVVFREESSGRILIIERKATGWEDGSIPAEAWPNIRAQLWCYAWIDDWVSAPEVILVCQFMRRRIIFENYGRRRVHNHQFPWINFYSSCPTFLRSDFHFHQECKELFIEYGGQIM